MKKQTPTTLAVAFAFSFLVFDQLPGINFALFTVLFAGALLFLNPGIANDRAWWSYALLALVAGASVFFVASALSVIATLVAIGALAGRTYASERSLLVSGAFAGLSIGISPYNMIKEGTAYLNHVPAGQKQGSKRKALVAVLIALGASLPFVLLYRASNPLFARFVDNINTEWVDPGRVVFTVFCIFVMYGLLKVNRFTWIEKLEDQAMPDIAATTGTETGYDNVSTVGLVLFSVLNLLLLFMNALDINQLYISRTLPAGITLSEFVHDAVIATIFSIVLALAFIVFLFRGELNFSTKGKNVRRLVFGWILQTALVIVSTVVRNCWYVGEYQLTELRIGVFVFLLLALIGLALTWFKIANKKSAWWLFTANAKVWFVLLVFSATVSWNRLITSYNISKAGDGNKPDIGYLLQLGGNLSQMVELTKSVTLDGDDFTQLLERVKQTERRIGEMQWPGYSMRMQRNKEAAAEFRRHFENARRFPASGRP